MKLIISVRSKEITTNRNNSVYGKKINLNATAYNIHTTIFLQSRTNEQNSQSLCIYMSKEEKARETLPSCFKHAYTAHFN